MLRWGWSALVGVIACSSADTEEAAADAGLADAKAEAGPNECGSIVCAADEYCDWEYDYCEGMFDSPSCRKRPATCIPEPRPSCGCDGVLYESSCAANLAGVDVALPPISGCTDTPGPDFFKCGPVFCKRFLEYCGKYSGDQHDTISGCALLPTDCGGADICTCLGTECSDPSFNPFCTDHGNGEVVAGCSF
jgi:hypothetical protein